MKQFFEVRKIVQFRMKRNTYATVAGRANPISNSNQQDNYRALDDKLIELELNDWTKFQEQLKKLHSSKIHQTEAQTELKKKPYNKQTKDKVK